MNMGNDEGRENGTGRGAEDALHTIGVLFDPGDVIEIRALQVGRTADRAGMTYSGYFNFENSTAIEAAIRRLDGRSEGVHVVLNRLNPELSGVHRLGRQGARGRVEGSCWAVYER